MSRFPVARRLGLIALAMVLLAFVGVAAASSVDSTPANVRMLRFPGTFTPDQVVSAAGSIWLVAEGPHCGIERMNPSTMAVAPYSTSECGFNVASGDGALFLEEDTPVASTNDHQLRILRVPVAPAGPASLSPVAMTVTGSAIAHTQLAFADGAVWLYGISPGGRAGLVQLSPTSGAIERTFSNVPPIGGTEPLIAAGAGAVWISGGPGSSAAVDRVDVATGGVQTGSTLAAGDATVEWLADVGGDLWVDVATFGGRNNATVGQHIEVIGANGRVLRHSSDEALGGTPAASAGTIWSSGPTARCGDGQPILSISPPALHSTARAILRPPFDPCLSDPGYRQLASSQGRAFVLDAPGPAFPAILYRVTK